ncbi:MAG TPA: Glu-tRNA(Gln) amidotransferase subunit GatE [Candidatus Bathyarchaeia archaeon]|nr:Glu-tRNA(Gln) amidotransferase subunit GatE [Candidatus Bathyarchaeia archaeon]
MEIHRQLDTRNKLFCQCPTMPSTKPTTLKYERRLRPTQSELGQVDPAALFEFHRGRTITYEADPDTACLVELDEEPPHPLNPEAIDVAMTISLLFRAPILDEIHVMRKIVIDGSNTTGFQRTAIIGLNGKLPVDGKEIPIQQVTLEEDAARKTGETNTNTVFRLDRLGVPLIEVATGPVIKSPEESGKVALAIGHLLRSTRRVKRGLGSIRQDLNVSIKQGALTEIKGVQELDLVSKAVEFEVGRQLELLRILDDLKERGVKLGSIVGDLVEITPLVSSSESSVVQSSLKKGGLVLAVKLPGFKGLLKRELMPGVRFGTEMARRAVFYGRVGGIFHSDELPAYGISQAEVDSIARRLNCSGNDAFAIVADNRQNAMDGLNAVVERAREAIEKIPEETRVANPDGTTQYLRPRPGAARMYPETDVPPVQIPAERIERMKASLPRSPEELAKQIETRYTISPKVALQLADSDYPAIFEEIVASSRGVAPSFIATFLTESLRSLSREGVPVENVSAQDLKEVFNLVASGSTAKESIAQIVKWLASHPGAPPGHALDELKLRMMARPDLEKIIAKVVASNLSYVAESGDKAIGKMMNLVMGEVRGKADPRLVNEILRSELDKVAD